MLKRTGNAKIVDIGSAFELDNAPRRRTCTPHYAAPEVLEGGECTPRSDLASLGYVLIEMLSGPPPVRGLTEPPRPAGGQAVSGRSGCRTSCRTKSLQRAADELLPPADRARPDAPLPQRRGGRPGEGRRRRFHRQLVKGDLASEYDNEIRLWLEELRELEELDQRQSTDLPVRNRAASTESPARYDVTRLQRRRAARAAAFLGRQDHVQRTIGVFQVARLADQTGHRAVKLREHLLADRPFALERFLVPAGLVEPHQRCSAGRRTRCRARSTPAAPPAVDRRWPPASCCADSGRS